MARGFIKDGKFHPTGKFKKSSKVQSVILEKDKFPTVTSARKKVIDRIGF